MLTGKRIVVTGASRGIGRAIALACAAAGARVGVNFRDQAPEDIGDGAIPLRFDVRDARAAAEEIGRFVETCGGIDGLVNNAAMNVGSLLVSASDDDIRAVIDTNLLGPIVCTRAAIGAMLRQRGGGVILNISSVAAVKGGRGQTVYAATKGGLEAFTRSLAIEYGRKGIRAVCIRPGAVDTDMFALTKELAAGEVLDRIPLRRFASPEEIARLAVWLLSDEAGYVTGSVYPIDGGFPLG